MRGPELMALEMGSEENVETKTNVAPVNDQAEQETVQRVEVNNKRDTAKVITCSDDFQCAISRSTKPEL